jgi:MFS superfamily sulfate permease-like transporter
VANDTYHPSYQIMSIGVLSLVILFCFPWAKKRIKLLSALPAQMIVLLVAIPLGYYFALEESQRVDLPAKITDAVVLPDFSHVTSTTSLKWIAMFFLVGSLESLLSAKAIDILDPWKRKTNMNRDLLGVGVANTAVASVGGLPMISEILRSSANIGSGGRTRLSNVFHGLFLLFSILFLAVAIERIPNAALGAMLVFAGFRLASPKEFIHMWHVGKEQFFVFALTVLCIVPTGNLLMVGVGMLAEVIINFINGGSFASLFSPRAMTAQDGDVTRISAAGSLTFSNWIPFKRRLEATGDAPTVVVDLSQVNLIDHTFMDKLVQSQREFTNAGRTLTLAGLEGHTAFGHEATSGRKKAIAA